MRRVAEFLVVAICTVAFAFTAIGICTLLLTGNSAGNHDFISYWAAGQQLIHHQNPYDADAILRIEHAAGFPVGYQALLMRNPPSALLLTLPLGFVGFRTAALLWSLLSLSCLIVSVRLLSPKGRLSFLGYTFAPALACLLAGQTSLLVLLGLVLFLRLHETRHFLAGCSLWLCALKPHLFLPFAVALILSSLIKKRYSLLAGAVLALAVSSSVALYFDPLVWNHYSQMMHGHELEGEFIPCLSVALRFALHSPWVQYLPALLGSIWAVFYFSKHSWTEHVGLLLLVSVLLAPYAWFTDQAVLIAALLPAAYLTSSRNMIAFLALISAAIEVQTLSGVSMHSWTYLWTAPAWITWYFFARSHAIKVNDPPTLDAAVAIENA